jgi:hypothetical protein
MLVKIEKMKLKDFDKMLCPIKLKSIQQAHVKVQRIDFWLSLKPSPCKCERLLKIRAYYQRKMFG